MCDNSRKAQALLCPSAQPEWADSKAIGVVGGTREEPRVSPFASAMPVTKELLGLSSPVSPTEVFRFAAKCVHERCAHFQNSKCQLIERIVGVLPPVSLEVPFCSIRKTCRWWQQLGAAACVRCPQVVTDNYNPSEIMVSVSEPSSKIS